MARLHKSDRFVLNGIDPADFIYSETKNNCFLFVVSGGIEKARSKKGLDTAFWNRERDRDQAGGRRR